MRAPFRIGKLHLRRLARTDLRRYVSEHLAL
jgi:hypothetical protein